MVPDKPPISKPIGLHVLSVKNQRFMPALPKGEPINRNAIKLSGRQINLENPKRITLYGFLL